MCGGPGPGGDGGSGGVDFGNAVTEAAGLVGGSGLGTSVSTAGNLGASDTIFDFLGLSKAEQDSLSQSIGQKGLGFVSSIIPGAVLATGALARGGAFSGPPGSIADMSAGGQAGPGEAIRTGFGSYTGPRAAPVSAPTVTPNAGVIEPGTVTPRVSFNYPPEKDPATIDAENRRRVERAKAYSKEYQKSEAEQLRELAMRDVAYAGGTETKLTQPSEAWKRYVGLPPVMGQSRHRSA